MYRDLVLKELAKTTDGFTITELATRLKTSRNTIAIACAYLEGAQKVTIRNVGMAKLYKLRGKAP